MKLLLFFSLGIIVISFGNPSAVFSQGGLGCPTGQICLNNPLGNTSNVSTLLNSIVDWLIAIASPIATAMIIYGAFQMITAGGEPEKFNKGKTTILYTAIGYAIVFIGWGIASIIEIALGG